MQDGAGTFQLYLEKSKLGDSFKSFIDAADAGETHVRGLFAPKTKLGGHRGALRVKKKSGATVAHFAPKKNSGASA